MKNNKLLAMFYFSFILYSCSQESEISKNIKKHSGLSISNYTIISREIDSNSDYSEETTLVFDSLTFSNLEIEIKKSIASSQATNLKPDKKWSNMPFGYRFEYVIRKNEYTWYEVNKFDRTLKVTYLKE